MNTTQAPGSESTGHAIWLLKLHRVLHEEISNTELLVPDLCCQMNMSRTALHRKIKEVTGISTTAYIRRFRLRYAARLLLEYPDTNISEIAHWSGFNNQSYFNRCFTKEFNCSPRVYRRRI